MLFLAFLFVLCSSTVSAQSLVQNLSGNAVKLSYADIVEPLLPTAISVSAMKTDDKTAVAAQTNSMFDDYLEQFYDEAHPEKDKKEILLGSGFILDVQQRLAVTNAHVVNSFSKVFVTLNDSRVVEADVVGKDSKTDLAVLKIGGNTPLTAVKMGDSDKTRTGDVVFALGNPFGLGTTVTSGIVSALSRNIQVGPYDDFIQTDAAINRGNSGGPLFNANGELIGVNTAIFSPSGGSVGVAFALPSKTAAWVVDSILKDGYVKRGRLGAKIQSVTEKTAQTLGLKEAAGALVAQITPDTPAADSGLQVGDVILNYNGIKIASMRDLPKLAAQTPIGSQVMLTVFRNGKTLEIPLIVDELKDEEKTPLPVFEKEDKTTVLPLKRLGISTANLSPAVRQKHRLGKLIKGVLISDAKKDGDAYKKGVRRGDVLLEIDRIPVQDVKDFAVWEKKSVASGDISALLLIERKGERFFAVVDLIAAEN